MINDPRFNEVLYMDDLDFGAKLIKAIGVAPGEKISISTPQFERTDGVVVVWHPSTVEEYEGLKQLDSASLKMFGCQIWEEKDDKTTWLYPHEWYDHVPDGLKIVDINGDTETFKKGETDNDMRFGALSFGFVQCLTP